LIAAARCIELAAVFQVDYNVAGYVAGTTPPYRTQIRRRLVIAVEPGDFDTFVRRHRQITTARS
jgi:hypothetical protein